MVEKDEKFLKDIEEDIDYIIEGHLYCVEEIIDKLKKQLEDVRNEK